MHSNNKFPQVVVLKKEHVQVPDLKLRNFIIDRNTDFIIYANSKNK